MTKIQHIIQNEHDRREKITNTILEMQRKGYSEPTLKYTWTVLLNLNRHLDLDKPLDVMQYVALMKCADSYKRNLCDAYNHYANFNSLVWSKPHYRGQSKLPFIATEERLNQIIAHASRKYALILSIIRDSGLRPVEISKLTLANLDLEKGIVSVKSAKGGIPRQLKLRPSTVAMFIEYTRRHNFNMSDKLFPKTSTICTTYSRLRTSVASKLQDSNIRKIRLYDYRHYYATMLYYKTRDILLVKESLGHRRIDSTLVYTHLIDIDTNDDYNVKTAKDIKEASNLIESGFEYVTTFDNIMLFRKRK